MLMQLTVNSVQSHKPLPMFHGFDPLIWLHFLILSSDQVSPTLHNMVQVIRFAELFLGETGPPLFPL